MITENKVLETDMILTRRPFRWFLDGELLNNGYESFNMETIISDNDLILVEKLNNDVAIVRNIFTR